MCQISALAAAPDIEIANTSIVQAYWNNPIARAICFQGLEPFDTFEDLYALIFVFRECYSINDDIIIYTGYNKNEIENQLIQLKQFSNIIVKFGRYVPNTESHYDEILGVKLASSNLYGVRIS